MSVEYTTITGYGFQISKEGIEKIERKMDADRETISEYLERKVGGLLTYVTAGSYWNGKVEYAISINRLTSRYDQFDGFEGFAGFGRTAPTNEEEEALEKARVKYLSTENRIGEFAGGLWS